MKKIILTAAAAIATIGAANAQSTDNNNGTLQVRVDDFIEMTPSTGFSAGPIAFSTPEAQVAGWDVSGTVSIRASRAWKYEYMATDFVRQNPNNEAVPAGVQTSVPAGNIWSVMTGSGTTGVNTYNGNYIPASNSLVDMANEGRGTVGSSFTLAGKLVPGLTNQMSGTYQTSITQIASLK